MIDAANKLVQRESAKNIRSILKRQVKTFSPLRDVQTQILQTHKLTTKYPVLYDYFHSLIKSEEKLVKEAPGKVSAFRTDELDYNFDQFLAEIPRSLKEKSLDYSDLFDIAQKLYDKVLKKHKKSTRDDLESLHKTRLAFKKFRYVMEILKRKAGLRKPDFKTMKAFQTRLGNIQDIRVYLENLNEFIEKEAKNEKNYQPVIDDLLAEQSKIIDEYYERFGEILKYNPAKVLD